MSDFESIAGIDEIIEKNPGVDRNQFTDAQKALEILRRSGVRGPSYDLESPYERRRPTGSEANVPSDEDVVQQLPG